MPRANSPGCEPQWDIPWNSSKRSPIDLRIAKLAEAHDQDQLLVRMLELLTRMVSAQAKLGEDPADQLAEVAELARQRMIAAGLAANRLPRPRQRERAGVREPRARKSHPLPPADDRTA